MFVSLIFSLIILLILFQYSRDRSAKQMDETDFSDISKAALKPSKSQSKRSVQWVKSTIKAYEEPGKGIPTNSFGECHFLGATRKAKGKVRLYPLQNKY